MMDQSLEKLVEAAVRRLIGRTDPATIERLARGEADLAVVEVNPISALIDGKSIDAAYRVLMDQTAAALKSYYKAPAALPGRTQPEVPARPRKGVAQEIFTADILWAEYGQKHEPPQPPRAPAATGRKRVPPASAKPFDVGDEAKKLADAASEVEARAILKKVTGQPNTSALAVELGVDCPKGATITAIKEAIYQQVVAPRLARNVYMSVGRG